MFGDKSRAYIKGQTLPPVVLNRDQVKAMMAAMNPLTFAGLRARTMIIFYWACMLRRQELLDLLLTDVDEVGIVTVRSGKGKKYRRVALNKHGLEIYNDWLKYREKVDLDSPWVMCTTRGTKMCDTEPKRILRMAARKAKIGVPRVHAHGLRHSGAVEMCRAGIPVPIISKALGHSNIHTTQTYLDHFLPEEVTTAMRSVVWT